MAPFDFLAQPRLVMPQLDADWARRVLEESFGATGVLVDLGSQQDRNFLLTASDDGPPVGVLKIAHPAFSLDEIAAQDLAAAAVQRSGPGLRVATPLREAFDGSARPVPLPGGGRAIGRVLTYVAGDAFDRAAPLSTHQVAAMGAAAARVTLALADFAHRGAERVLQWDVRHAPAVLGHLLPFVDEPRRSELAAACHAANAALRPLAARLPVQAVHLDVTDRNLIADPGTGDVDGLIDFGDLTRTWRIAELASTLAAVLAHPGAEPAGTLPAIAAFHALNPLAPAEIEALWPAVVLRAAILVASSSQQLSLEPDNTYVAEELRGEELIATRALSVPLDTMHEMLLAALVPPSLASERTERAGQGRAGDGSDEQLLARRRAVLADVQEHYYARPPRIERGWRHWLYDTAGRGYLDLVNNVAILGHCHPAVTEAGARQLAKLNTNSRFHYAAIVEFAEQLVATLPGPLDTVFFVNSGSEAVDLALRLALAATSRRDVVALREAYHGWTYLSDAISTSLADNPAALATRPPWVHTLPCPNTYRGPYRGSESSLYALEAADAIGQWADDGRAPAAFIAEPIFGAGGGMLYPDGYLASVYGAIRKAGGIAISDEVQVGYGRTGRWFWGFEQQGVVPDVVTFAKAAGNGFPLGAVITRREIAQAYRSQGYFFSSTGGSPLSCVIGSTVLQVVLREDLQGNALRQGEWLRAGLERLALRHGSIGAIHGSGLFMGLELVADRVSREPATGLTARLCERMRGLGVIVQPTGERNNIVKIKPPLTFDEAAGAAFLTALDLALAAYS